MASNFYFRIKQELYDSPSRFHFYSSARRRLFRINLDFRYISPLNFDSTTTFQRSITCSRTLIFSNQLGLEMIRYIFSGTGSSDDFIRRIGSDILSFAREIDCDPINAEREVLEISIQVFVEDEEEEIMEREMCESWIDCLERVKLWEIGTLVDYALPIKKRRKVVLGWNKECVICLEGFCFWSDEEVVRIPCGHIFHGDCIVKWVEKSDLCPLCRYQMPPGEDLR